MKKWLLLATVLFSLLIVATVVVANADMFPRWVKRFIDVPGVDKAGHFILFGILSFLLNKSVLALRPNRIPARLILTVSLLLSIVIGFEEWSQSLFPARTMSLADLLASYAGVAAFAILAYWTK
ncbi:MAG: VanZ family protein [Anaerolineales bacterium]